MSPEALMLVDSLISMRPFNLKALEHTMTRVWREAKGLKCKMLGEKESFSNFKARRTTKKF